MQQRNSLLDILKGFAILSVVLYHLGVLTFGYLGVEVFLVIGGYLITKSMLRSNDNYWTFINKRLVRLWPLLLLLSALALGFGWKWMLPIHYKLNCEAVIGTGTFVNNIIQYVTSGNYWMADNEYKPLMHTWYVGIMMQFYLIYPIVFIVNKKLSKDWIYCSFVTLVVVFGVSLGIYLSPYLSTEQNFYFLQSRLFEFAAGGMIALYYSLSNSEKRRRCIMWVMGLAAIITLLLVSNMDMDAKKVRLIITVGVTTMFTILAANGYKVKWQECLKPIALCGTASFSLYLFHQFVFAFYRYAFDDQFTWLSYIIIIVVVLAVGFFSFYLLEQPLGKYVKGNMKHVYIVNTLCGVFLILLSAVSFHFYRENGMVRDIPELDLYMGENSETPEDYNGRAYNYDKNFEKNGKINVLVIGDSFGRDWVNILLESGIDSIANISYYTEPDKECEKRINASDYVFIANNTTIYERYGRIMPLAMDKKFYRVGRKSYGSWIGIVYNNNRYGVGYYNQKVAERDATVETSDLERSIFGGKFIDMMAPLKDKNNMVPIFYNKKLITQDCIHLTKWGAKLYAKKLNIKQYFNK